MKRSFVLTLGIFCLLLNVTAGAAFAADYAVVGQGKNGMYKEIVSPDGTDVTLERHTKIIEAGGICFEGDPTFTIKGTFQGNLPLDLTVESRDVVVEVEGIQAVAQVDYLVSGKIGAEKISISIMDDHPIVEIEGGLKVQAGFRKQIKEIGCTFESVSEYQDMCGMKIETNRYHVLNGQGDTSLRVDSFPKDAFSVSGNGSTKVQALLVVLRPFLLQ